MTVGFVTQRRRATAAAAALALFVWVVPGELSLVLSRSDRACPMRCASTKDCCCKRTSRTSPGKQAPPSVEPARTRCRLDCAPATLLAKTASLALAVEPSRTQRATASSRPLSRTADEARTYTPPGPGGPRAPPNRIAHI